MTAGGASDTEWGNVVRTSPGERFRLLETGERVANLGSWEWLPGPDKQLWSDNLFRIFGVEPSEVTPTREFVSAQTHPNDRERVARYVEMTRHVTNPPPIEYRVQQPGRGTRYLRSTIETVETGAHGAERIVGVVQDVTEQRLAGREIAAHLAVSGVLAGWKALDEDGMRLLRGLAEAMGFVIGIVWVPDRDLLVARLVWSESALPEMPGFRDATLGLRFPSGVGLVGRVWEAKAPVGVTNVLADRGYRRREPAAGLGLHGALGFPALHAGEVLAVFEFYDRDELVFSARLIQTMRAIGYELGEFLSRRRSQLYSNPLTPREVQVLQLAADGCSGPEIAERLGVSVGTIATHMKHIYESLGVSDRASAVAVGIRSGVIR